MNKKTLSLIALALLIMTLLATTVAAQGVLTSIEDTITKTLGPYADKTYVKVAINAIIIAVLGAIVVAVVKGKDAEAKTTMQLYLAIVAIAIVIGMAIGNRFLWDLRVVENFLHAKVAINTVLYAGLFYGAYAIFIKKKLEDKGASANMFAVLAIIVLAFSISMGPFSPDKTWNQVEPTYQYLWQKEDVIRLKFFAFGSPDVAGGQYTEAQVQAAIKLDNPDYVITDNRTIGDGSEPDYSSAVLKGTGMFILLFGTILLIWLFSSIDLNKDMPALKWVLAIFIASNMANSGMEKGTFVNIAMVIFGYLLYRGMAQNTEKGWMKYGQIGFVVLITYWLFSTMFPDDVSMWSPIATLFGPIIGGIFGSIGGVLGDLGIGYVIGGIVLILLIFKFMSKVTNGAYEMTAGRDLLEWWRVTWRDKYQELRSALGERYKILHMADAKSNFATDRMHPHIVRLNAEYQAHMDYMLRFEVFYSKFSAVQNNVRKAQKIKAKFNINTGYSYTENLAKMDLFKWGSEVQAINVSSKNPITPKAFVVSLKNKPYDFIDINGKPDKFHSSEAGFLNNNYVVLAAFESYFQLLTSDLGWDKPSGYTNFDDTYQKMLADRVGDPTTEKMYGTKAVTKISSFTDIAHAQPASAAHHFWETYWAIGLQHHLKVIWNELTDQYLLGGPAYPRTYRFAVEGTKPEVWKVKVIGRDPDNTNYKGSYFHRPDWSTLRKEPVLGDPLDAKDINGQDKSIEIDWHGFVNKDLEKIGFHGPAGGWATIRRVKRNEAIMGDVAAAGEGHEADWFIFMEDVTYGVFTKFTRRVGDYQKFHRQSIVKKEGDTSDSDDYYKRVYYGKWNERVKPENFTTMDTNEIKYDKKLSYGNPAFDREAFKNYGSFDIWGTKTWWETEPQTANEGHLPPKGHISKIKPFPAITMLGNSIYFPDLIDNLIQPASRADEEIRRFVYVKGEADFTNRVDAQPKEK